MRSRLRAKYSASLAMRLASSVHERFDLAPIEPVEAAHDPSFAGLVVIGKQLDREFPQMLAGVINIHHLDGVREVLTGQVSDPNGSITDYNFLLRRRGVS